MTPEELEKQFDEKIERLEKRLDALTVKMEDILSLLKKLEGASTLAKIVFFALVPLITIGNWLRDHLK